MLGQAAQDRFLYGYADRFFRLAISADVLNAHESLLDLLLEQGRYDLFQAELVTPASRSVEPCRQASGGRKNGGG